MDVAQVEDIPTLLILSYHKYDADNQSNHSMDLGGTEGEAKISMMQTKFSFIHVAQGSGSPNTLHIQVEEIISGWVLGEIPLRYVLGAEKV